MKPRSGFGAIALLGAALAAGGVALAAAGGAAYASSRASDLSAYAAFVRSPAAERLFAIAREAMQAHWSGVSGRRDTTEIAWPASPTGVYLSLVDATGTRACVGNPQAYRAGLAETVRALARDALQSDRRRDPIRREELSRLRIVIAFAGDAEPIEDPLSVNPSRDGLLIRSGVSSIAFLPGEARTVHWALREARRVGVLQDPREQASYFRFPVVAFSELRSPRSSEEEPHVSP